MEKYNKLVRDKILEIISADGKKAIAHEADDKEYGGKLFEKFLEEGKELLQKYKEGAPIDDLKGELADISEVQRAICRYLKISLAKLEQARKKKAKERGAFKKRIILESVE
jgi:predicted house-cleaning noncanonical NTP pyrophosphatase (MazG superfamily)